MNPTPSGYDDGGIYPVRTRYAGPRHYNRAFRQAYMTIRAQFPDCYTVPGLGWCGPGWQELTDRLQALDRAAHAGKEGR